jgi:hypothetical protein
MVMCIFVEYYTSSMVTASEIFRWPFFFKPKSDGYWCS